MKEKGARSVIYISECLDYWQVQVSKSLASITWPTLAATPRSSHVNVCNSRNMQTELDSPVKGQILHMPDAGYTASSRRIDKYASD